MSLLSLFWFDHYLPFHIVYLQQKLVLVLYSLRLWLQQETPRLVNRKIKDSSTFTKTPLILKNVEITEEISTWQGPSTKFWCRPNVGPKPFGTGKFIPITYREEHEEVHLTGPNITNCETMEVNLYELFFTEEYVFGALKYQRFLWLG